MVTETLPRPGCVPRHLLLAPRSKTTKPNCTGYSSARKKSFTTLLWLKKISACRVKKDKSPTPQGRVLREISIQRNLGSGVTWLKQPLLRSGGTFVRAVAPCKPTKGRLSLRFVPVHPELRMCNSSVNFLPIIQQHQLLRARGRPVLLTQKLSCTRARGGARQSSSLV